MNKDQKIAIPRTLSDKITHKIIDFLFHLPFRSGSTTLSNLAKKKPNKDWIAPAGYTNTIITRKHLKLEMLTQQNQSNPQNKLILQFHGGGYLMKLINLYRYNAVRYSKLSNADVLTFDYRVAPEHHYPTALEDALIAWEYALECGYKAEDIIFAGDSAGGNLAIALTLYLRDNNLPLPKALILMSPWTDLSFSFESYTRNDKVDPMFGRHKESTDPNAIPRSLTFSYAGDLDLQDPRISPAFAEFHNFPPALIQVGTYEILEDDAEIIFQKIDKAGGEVTLSRYVEMFHVFQLSAKDTAHTKAAWEEVENYIKFHFK